MSNIINKVTYENYTHWIEYFVQRVLTESNVDYGEVVITDIDYGNRIFLSIDGEEYIVRTLEFIPVKGNEGWEDGESCAESVEYTLYKMVKDQVYGVEVYEGIITINGSMNNMKYNSTTGINMSEL